ncbi:hypothetical protein [Gallibacterium anatis]|uniref:Uncharacterized protein n=1 Tax=Gallibacterium anatis TaxID=750 RepID=A0A0A2XDL9_9PAST|nr:hypothetical protein [Gallibacterium anatis]KGQ30218.1 hypothetical protein JP32_09245 [Gallibacterium anatis]
MNAATVKNLFNLFDFSVWHYPLENDDNAVEIIKKGVYNAYKITLTDAQAEKLCQKVREYNNNILKMEETTKVVNEKFDEVIRKPLEAEEISAAPVEKLYFCRYEDNLREIYRNESHAKEWDEKSPLHFVDEVEYDESHNIVKFNGLSVKDFVETLDDEPEEVERLTDWIYSDYAYPSALSD